MENVVLVILLIFALALIAVVLLQRSEGGGLGMGGGGGAGGGVMSSRSAATALGKVTWFLGAGFMAASVAMTIIAANNSADGSVVNGLTDGAGVEQTAPVEDGTSLLPPTVDANTPVVPAAD
ncbi:preprotein translocase subunit SecG [Aestuariibius sp. HNIBRBA575]|uniref:preprotein translocase subunit SecG n=1 Tax=Aestuariibius sp. HNIBRBA575 TaxID=3233343 RepID=UPI0034A2A936